MYKYIVMGIIVVLLATGLGVYIGRSIPPDNLEEMMQLEASRRQEEYKQMSLDFMRAEFALFVDKEHTDVSYLKLAMTEEAFNKSVGQKSPGASLPDRVHGLAINFDHVTCEITGKTGTVLATGVETLDTLSYNFVVYIEYNEDGKITKYTRNVQVRE